MKTYSVVGGWSLPTIDNSLILIRDMARILVTFFVLTLAIILPQAIKQQMDNRSKAADLAVVDTSLINENVFRFELSDSNLTVQCSETGACTKSAHVKVFNKSAGNVDGAIISLQGNWTAYTQVGSVNTTGKQMVVKGPWATDGLVYEGDLTATRLDKTHDTEYEIFSVSALDCSNGGMFEGCMPVSGQAASNFMIKFLTTLLSTSTPTATPVPPTPTPTGLPSKFWDIQPAGAGSTGVVCYLGQPNCVLNAFVGAKNTYWSYIWRPTFRIDSTVSQMTYRDMNNAKTKQKGPASLQNTIDSNGSVMTQVEMDRQNTYGTWSGNLYVGGEVCSASNGTSCNTLSEEKSYDIAYSVIPKPTPTVDPNMLPTPLVGVTAPPESRPYVLQKPAYDIPSASGTVWVSNVTPVNNGPFWNYTLSGWFTGLRGSSQYQIWLLNSNNTGGAGAGSIFTTDALGRGGFVQVVYDNNQTYPITKIALKAIQDEGTTCGINFGIENCLELAVDFPTVVPTATPTPTMAPTITVTPTLTIAPTPTATPAPTIAPTLTPVPTAAIVVQQSQQSSGDNGGGSSSSGGGGGSSSSSSSGGGGGGCGDSFPWGVPYVTAITAGNNWARITFNGKANPVNQYRIWYGEYKNKRMYNSVVSSSSNGSVMAVVNGLKANTRYYFAVQPLNGCKEGTVGSEWYNTTTKTAKQTRTVSRKEPVVKVSKKK